MSQLVTRGHPRIRLNRLRGLFLTAALVLMFLSAFTSASPAHASGGCWSYNTWSDSATHQESNNPIIYWNDNGGPKLGLGLSSCDQYIMYMGLSEECVLISAILILTIRSTGSDQD